MNLTDEDVEEILRLLEKSPYNELKVKTDRFTLEVRPESSGVPTPAADTAPDETDAESPADQSEATAGKPAPQIDAVPGEVVDIYPPLPGTFYRAPSPGAEPFTDVGKTVAADTILGLVETMKLMSSVTAGCHGEVIEICADNESLIEAGDVLMRIRVADNG